MSRIHIVNKLVVRMIVDVPSSSPPPFVQGGIMSIQTCVTVSNSDDGLQAYIPHTHLICLKCIIQDDNIKSIKQPITEIQWHSNILECIIQESQPVASFKYIWLLTFYVSSVYTQVFILHLYIYHCILYMHRLTPNGPSVTGPTISGFIYV